MTRTRVAAVGEALPEREFGPVTQTHIVRFAGAGGDFNPLHHDPAFAEKAGFDGVIAMGQLQAGILAGWLTDWCGMENLRELDVRFRALVRLGAVLRFSGEVTAVESHGDGRTAALSLRGHAGAEEVVRATAVVRIDGVNRRSAQSLDQAG